MDTSPQLVGRVTISPKVLTTIVRQTALGIDGVQSLASRPPKRSRVPGRRAVDSGIEVIVSDGQVHVVLHINADPGANMYQLAETLQREVASAIERIVGLDVIGVDVRIDNVSLTNGANTS